MADPRTHDVVAVHIMYICLNTFAIIIMHIDPYTVNGIMHTMKLPSIYNSLQVSLQVDMGGWTDAKGM